MANSTVNVPAYQGRIKGEYEGRAPNQVKKQEENGLSTVPVNSRADDLNLHPRFAEGG